MFSFIRFKINLFRKLGMLFKKKARKEMKKVSYGRPYYYRGRIHIASKPYDPPNTMSGALLKTINYKVNSNSLILGAGSSSIDYSKYLEQGTRNMEPRPNLINIFSKNEKEIKNMIDKEIKTEFNKNVIKYKI